MVVARDAQKKHHRDFVFYGAHPEGIFRFVLHVSGGSLFITIFMVDVMCWRYSSHHDRSNFDRVLTETRTDGHPQDRTCPYSHLPPTFQMLRVLVHER